MTTVLIIEDDADIADTIQACVQSEGHKWHWANAGETGLKLCQQLQPDLVILDIGLPGMNGLEVCTQIRATKLRREPYILMLTARQEALDFLVGYATGADDYLAKPFSPKMLLARMQSLLQGEVLRKEIVRKEVVRKEVVQGELMLASRSPTISSQKTHQKKVPMLYWIGVATVSLITAYLFLSKILLVGASFPSPNNTQIALLFTVNAGIIIALFKQGLKFKADLQVHSPNSNN